MTILNHFSTFYNAIKNKFAFKSDVYTKDDVYSKKEVYTKSEVYTKDQVDSIKNNIAYKNDVYTKNEIDTHHSNLVFSIKTNTINFDGNTDGLDTFIYNARNYVKVSSEIIDRKYTTDVITYDDSNRQSLKGRLSNISENCFNIGYGICVEKAGACKLSVTDDVAYSFTAPSSGIYLIWGDLRKCNKIEYPSEVYDLSVPDLINGTIKKFELHFDDSGTISATEVL